MSPVEAGRFVPGPSPWDDMEMSADPLAALTGRLRPLRWLMKAVACVLVVAGFLLCMVVFGWFIGTLLANGIPWILGGEPVMGDTRDFFVEWSRVAPALFLPALVTTIVSAAVLWGLAHLAARMVHRPIDAMVDHFQRRIEGASAEFTDGTTKASTWRRWTPTVVKVIGVVVVVVATWVVATTLWFLPPSSVADWFVMVMIWVFVVGGCWFVLVFANLTIPFFVGPLGISSGDIDALQQAGAETRLAKALERWPEDGEPLRLRAAVTVFSGRLPPKPKDHDRALEVPWTGETTGVEILAGTLLAEAVVEAERLGFMKTRIDDGRVTLSANVPKDRRPEGLARIVLGHRRFGLVQGRLVSGSTDDVLASWMWGGDEDPHWVVIEIALADLQAVGVLVDGQVDRDALASSADGSASLEEEKEMVARLARDWAKELGKRRTVEAGPGFLALASLGSNRAERAGRRLPSALQKSQSDF
jgi:hypothetical protein